MIKFLRSLFEKKPEPIPEPESPKEPDEPLDDGDFYITGPFGVRGMKWSDYVKRGKRSY